MPVSVPSSPNCISSSAQVWRDVVGRRRKREAHCSVLDISVMTIIWKFHSHFASNGIDQKGIWALYQKITTLEARKSSKYVMKP
jgi:hypothetical protein